MVISEWLKLKLSFYFILSTKFSRKLQFISSLKELSNVIPTEHVQIPDCVKQWVTSLATYLFKADRLVICFKTYFLINELKTGTTSAEHKKYWDVLISPQVWWQPVQVRLQVALQSHVRVSLTSSRILCTVSAFGLPEWIAGTSRLLTLLTVCVVNSVNGSNIFML